MKVVLIISVPEKRLKMKAFIYCRIIPFVTVLSRRLDDSLSSDDSVYEDSAASETEPHQETTEEEQQT